MVTLLKRRSRSETSPCLTGSVLGVIKSNEETRTSFWPFSCTCVDQVCSVMVHGTAACKYVNKLHKTGSASYAQRACSACFVPVLQKMQINRLFTLSLDRHMLSGVHKKRQRNIKSSAFVRMIGVEPTRREALAPETSVSTISPHPRRCWDCKDIKCFLISNIDGHLIEQYYTHLTYPILQSESLQKKDYNPIPPLHLPKMAKSSHILPCPDIPLLQISSDEAHHHPPPS